MSAQKITSNLIITLVVFFTGISASGIHGEDLSNVIGSEAWKNKKENQIQRKFIRGAIINSNYYGLPPYQNLGKVVLKKPNMMYITIRDTSIADASSKLIKIFEFKNIRQLPQKYSLNVSDVTFYKGLTYSLTVNIVFENSEKYSKGNYSNSIRHSIDFNKSSSNIANLDIYVGRIEE